MNTNYSIKCDVTKCKHNSEGCNCCLETVKITCCNGLQCTCCGDYSERE